LDILELQLNDNVKACLVGDKMLNIPIENKKPLIRSQMATYDYLKKKYKPKTE
jgi:polyphosphate kinase